MSKNKGIQKLSNYLYNWEKSNNHWFQKDEELTDEIFNIHEELIENDVSSFSKEYWNTLEEEIYIRKKDILLKYYSTNN